MGLGPFTVGQTLPTWTVTAIKTDNSAVDLTGATFTGVLYDQEAGIRKALTVVNFTATNPNLGMFSYAPTSTDVDTPGLWSMETAAAVGGGTYYIVVPDIRIKQRLGALAAVVPPPPPSSGQFGSGTFGGGTFGG